MNYDMSSYFEDPEFKEALAKYEGMVENHTPAYFEADELIDIAEYYTLKGRHKDADKAIDLTLQLHPENTDALVFRIRSLMLQNKKEEAKVVAQLIANSTDRECRFLQADMLMEEDRIEEAEEIFKHVNDIFNEYNDLKDVYDENRILKEKLDSYVNIESENEVLQSEIKKLKKLTEMDYLPNDYKTKAASVQIRDQTNWNDEITIDAGSLNNVQEGMAVCDSKGMIGVVSHVTEISSTVSLLTSENPSNQIPVMIINGDQTIYGLLKNYDVNKKVLNITLLSGIDKLEKNAKVYTSGLGGDGKCPKGIYIGKAKKLVTQSDGTTMTLTVKMAAQFKDLSYVSVVKKVNGNEE